MAILSATDLSGEETRELSYLGVAMGQMVWLRLYSNATAFREGVERGKGRVFARAADSSLDTFDAVFTYCCDNPYPEAPHHINIESYEALQAVVGKAVERLYKLGIAK